jgi:O-antigen ligase
MAATTAPPTPSPTPVADTLAFRLNRVPAALADIKTSPIIGLGAAAFGQRHIRPDVPETRDYIGMLALVAVYETGIMGALALAAGFVLLLALLVWRGKGDVGRAAAYAGSITAFLVSYEATNALWFSINWLIVGAALAFVVRARRSASASFGPRAD